MTYRYLNNPRFQWIFETPNQCAAILVICAMVLIGCFLFFSEKSHENKHQSKKWMSFSLGTFLACLFCEYWLVQTYSRGGYVAFFAGLFFLTLLTRQKRILIILASFIALLLMAPDGASRTLGMANTASDASIGNRLELWKGAFAMSADYWQSGVGFNYDFGGPFLDMYSTWYQPLWMRTSYNSAVCDYLSLSAKGGIFFLFGYLALIFTVLFLGYMLYRKNRNVLLAGLLSAQIAYLTSAIFSSFYHTKSLIYSFFVLQILTLFLVIFSLVKNRKFCSLRKCAFVFFVPMAMAGMMCVSLLLLGIYFRSQMLTRYTFQKYENLKIAIITPQKKTIQGVVLYLFDSDEKSLEKEAKLTLRPLAEEGFVVISAKNKGGFKGLKESQKLSDFIIDYAQKRQLPVMFLGQGEGGRFAMILAAAQSAKKIKAVASIASVASWPFSELSPKEHLKDLRAPLFLIFGEKSSFTASEISHFLILKKRYHLSMEFLNIQGEFHYLGSERKKALRKIGKFFLKNIR